MTTATRIIPTAKARSEPPMLSKRQSANGTFQPGKTHRRPSPSQSKPLYEASAKSWDEIERIREGIEPMGNDPEAAVAPLTNKPVTCSAGSGTYAPTSTAPT
jgi:hypothetical protein